MEVPSSEYQASIRSPLSNGYAAILLAMQLCGHVDLYGFGRGKYSNSMYYSTTTKQMVASMQLEAQCIDAIHKVRLSMYTTLQGC